MLGSDYSLSSSVFTGRPGNPNEFTTTFRADNIAQEINETAKLRLVLTTAKVPPEAIFEGTIEFLIEDSDGNYKH